MVNITRHDDEKEIIARTRIGIIGGGQLGLMLSEAARAMGFQSVTVLDPTPSSPASAVATQIEGSLKDPSALRELASHDIPVAPFLSIDQPEDLERALREWGYPLVLKAKKDAYDGRGNARINGPADIQSALDRLVGRELYVEQGLALDKELGIMIARNERGDLATFPVVEMIHARDICETVLAPAPISAALQEEAQKMARKAIASFNGIGIFGVEMFLDKSGRIWLNEIAPRPHNLGHFTIEACQTSQFEQHLRAVTNLPLGPTTMLYPAAVMENILGTRSGPAEPHWSHLYDPTHVFPHIYGKRETRFDRKMGHITVVGDDLATAYRGAKEARAAFSI